MNSNSRKIIYSALVGGYDNIPVVTVNNSEWEFILFTDFKTDQKEINGWKILPLIKEIKGDPVRTNRWHKINSHLLFENCLCTIYIDCNILIKDNYIFNRADNLLANDSFLAMVAHPSRTCIYEEAKACVKIGKDTKTNIQKNIDFLIKENYPKNNGLFENNLIFRNHSSSSMEPFNKLWWSLVENMARRDQLSLSYVLWKLNIQPEYFFEKKSKNLRSHPSFTYITGHKINNNLFEISENELEIIKKNSIKDQKELKRIKKSITYKFFYKTERGIRNLFKLNKKKHG
ncbi:MAG: hypothetical protein COA88_12110 [Kordia sp.]|nr:MAG: hypothetical protein COA88_12110 [Kordia sp.]